MQFIITTQTKIVSASGVMERRSPWKVSFTWPSTNSRISSTNAWPFDGTPAVARRAAQPNQRMNIRPSTSDTTHVSMWKPPPPTWMVFWVR